MRLAIMQPYFFPYLGYFQLIHSVDQFVIYDDVNFRKQSWINRNYLYSQGGKQRFTLQVLGASSNQPINKIGVGQNRLKLLKTIQSTYAKAPYFEDVYPLLSDMLLFENNILSEYIAYSLHKVCSFLGISTEIMISSKLDKDNTLKGEEKVLSICELLNASVYINASGGKDLYSRQTFMRRGIRLEFLQMKDIRYQQFGAAFVPGLSIIDVMMFTSRTELSQLINEFELI